MCGHDGVSVLGVRKGEGIEEEEEAGGRMCVGGARHGLGPWGASAAGAAVVDAAAVVPSAEDRTFVSWACAAIISTSGVSVFWARRIARYRVGGAARLLAELGEYKQCEVLEVLE